MTRLNASQQGWCLLRDQSHGHSCFWVSVESIKSIFSFWWLWTVSSIVISHLWSKYCHVTSIIFVERLFFLANEVDCADTYINGVNLGRRVWSQGLVGVMKVSLRVTYEKPFKRATVKLTRICRNQLMDKEEEKQSTCSLLVCFACFLLFASI